MAQAWRGRRAGGRHDPGSRREASLPVFPLPTNQRGLSRLSARPPAARKWAITTRAVRRGAAGTLCGSVQVDGLDPIEVVGSVAACATMKDPPQPGVATRGQPSDDEVRQAILRSRSGGVGDATQHPARHSHGGGVGQRHGLPDRLQAGPGHARTANGEHLPAWRLRCTDARQHLERAWVRPSCGTPGIVGTSQQGQPVSNRQPSRWDRRD